MDGLLSSISNLPEKVHFSSCLLIALFYFYAILSVLFYAKNRGDKYMEVIEDKLGMGDTSALKQIVDHVISDEVHFFFHICVTPSFQLTFGPTCLYCGNRCPKPSAAKWSCIWLRILRKCFRLTNSKR
jgi:hypothetical protein